MDEKRLPLTDWLQSLAGRFIQHQERQLMNHLLPQYIGSCLLCYQQSQQSLDVQHDLKVTVSIGEPGTTTEVLCLEDAWPLADCTVDVVVLQHSLDFAESPHGLLREASRVIRPGGHLLLTGLNRWSLWGMRQYFAVSSPLIHMHCLSARRIKDWLHLLSFGVEHLAYGCYRPPVVSESWQDRLVRMESLGRWSRMPWGGFYLIAARKLMSGVRLDDSAIRISGDKMVTWPVVGASKSHKVHDD